MNDERFIIEHQTRGVLFDQDYDPYGGSKNVYLEWRSRFSPTKPRSDGLVFYGRENVRLGLSRIDPTLRRWCKVRRYGTWSEVTL